VLTGILHQPCEWLKNPFTSAEFFPSFWIHPPRLFCNIPARSPATRWWVTTRWFLLTKHLFFCFCGEKKGVKNKPVGKGKIPLKFEENLVEKFDATSGIFKNLVR